MDFVELLKRRRKQQSWLIVNHTKRALMKLTLRCMVSLAALAMCASAVAQKTPSTTKDNDIDTTKGFTEIESFQGTVNSSENVLKLDSTLGWDFNKHFGVFAGVPVYFVHVNSTTTTAGGVTTTTPSSSNNGIGNFYAGLSLRAASSAIDYSSALTAGAPTADTKKGLSSGRGTVDWDNRFEHAFSRLTPFFDAGLGNTVPDSRLYTRPFTSLGFVAHLEEGAEFSLSRYLSVGASAYQIVPSGNQKIYSKLVAKGGAAAGTGKHNRVFETAATSSGNDLTRENGFNSWINIQPNSIWTLELGFTRSTTFDLSNFAFNLRMNFGKLLRSKKTS